MPENNDLNIIQQIKNGTIDANSLDIKIKINCTELLSFDGYTQSQIAYILKTSDRNIRRYLKIIRKRNAQEITPEFIREFMGNVIKKENNRSDRLTRLAMNPNTNPALKIASELAASHIDQEVIKRLIQLGYLISKEEEYSRWLSRKELPPIPPIINFIGVTPKGKKYDFENDPTMGET